MSDMTIIGIIALLMAIGAIRIGWRAGVHLNAPPRKRSEDD